VNARRALAALVAAFALVACTSGSTALPQSPSRPPERTSTRSPVPRTTPAPLAGPGLVGPSASRALAKLCPNRPTAGSQAPAEGPAPAIVGTVERRVEQIRGLHFIHRVPVEAVSHDELVAGLRQTFAAAYPAGLYRRRSMAWATMGAIPPGTDIREQLESFASSQVIGYYDEVSKYLVFLGADNPTPGQVVTLAHELTHAVDDQHFGLLRLDQLSAECADEAFEAALALTEGDATYVMIAYARRYLTLEQQLGMLGDSGGSLASSIAPFILRLETWPYTAGETFVQSLVTSGGTAAVDRAFRHLPASTEQILHPSSYPNDIPVAVDIPQLAPKLGHGWRDLDVQEVGAAWLSVLLGLRIDPDRATAAVDGWKGGIYRAWTDGADVAVELRTTWASRDAASGFASAMGEWLAAGDETATVEPVTGSDVVVMFGSNGPTLATLRSAA
jgi:hypothetical protein